MDNCFPKLLEETVIMERGGKFLFLVPSKPDWVVTNKNGAIALKLCNGRHTLNDIRSLLVEHPNSDQAVSLIENLRNDGFFEHRSKDMLYFTPQLRSVHLNISPKCNLECIYCYAKKRKIDHKCSLTLDEYKVLIDSIAEINNGVEIAITGGEPLLNNDACEIAQYCRKKGMYTHLLTNATTIDKNNFCKIASSFNVIRVSIDGFTADMHDYHRGVGSFQKTVNAIDLLDIAGANIRFAMTVTRKNMDDISQMAERYGQKLIFQPLFNTEIAKKRNLTISGEEYFLALKKAKGVEPYSQISQVLISQKNKGTTKCAIGDVEISISHNGDVYPCHMLHLPKYFAGNIREQSISEIYIKSPVLIKARNLSVNTRKYCRECPIRLLCGGTCRARAYYLSGDLDSADGFCEYEFLAFTEGLLDSIELVPLEKNSCNGFKCGIVS